MRESPAAAPGRPRRAIAVGAVVGQRVCGDLIEPFPVQVIQTDIQRCRISVRLHYHVLDKGVGHRYIKPRTPRLNGKVERSHRIDAEECYAMLDGPVIDDAKVFNNKLREWEEYHNYHRPHGGLNGQKPHERLRQKLRPSRNRWSAAHNSWCPH